MKKSQLLFLFLLSLAGKTYAQRKIVDKSTLYWEAIALHNQPLRESSVRMWEYDTTTHQQMSAPFSGVVVTEEGHILTVAHTTTPGHIYQVNFYDGQIAIAQALGKINFPETPELPDVAMMKIITPGKWKSVTMGRSAFVEKGATCFSIAYPETVNQPSPMLRRGYITNVKNDKGFIESTCVMEPGDSGGPMFDEYGQLIGLRSAIGIDEKDNYDVPVDLYRKYWTALNKPVHYTKYPELTDSLSATPQRVISHIGFFGIPVKESVKPSELDAYCVKVTSQVDGKSFVINGTVFNVNGHSFVVSKSSVVGETPVISYKKKQIKAGIIARDRENDLVLLAPVKDIKTGLGQKKDIDSTYYGMPLLSPQTDTLAVRSVLGLEPFNLPKMSSSGFLGAAIAPDKQPLVLTFVMPGSPAAGKGATPGDEIISINGVLLEKPEDYGRELYKYWPGDTIIIKRRQHATNTGGPSESGTTHYAAEVNDSIILGKRPLPPIKHNAELFRGGKSDRRDGFKQVIAHDGILRPEQCGGPVFDPYGHFIGVNIARLSRTTTLTLPAGVVYDFIRQHLPGKE